MIERFGKFNRIAYPGLHFKIPFIERISGKLNMRIRQLDVPVETKTEDNVFVSVSISVQFFVLNKKEYDAFYKLENAEKQITSYVFDVVRARVPKMILDNLFDKKDEIADAVKKELTGIMEQFGYGIIKALVTDIDPDPKVKAAMNEINEAERLRVAATERGEAEKILIIKEAEGQARSNALRGKGIADERRAIIDGLKESIDDFQKSISGTGPMEVMNLVLLTQYFDSLKEIGTSQNNSSIFMPHTPNALSDMTSQMRDALMQANQASTMSKNNPLNESTKSNSKPESKPESKPNESQKGYFNPNQ
jgi:regulator of protease activity HflC (stomatin/prohibitin superfamily)